MKRILILTAPAGGGHTATAMALAAAIKAEFPGKYEVRVADVFRDFDLPISLERITTPLYSESVRWLKSYPYKLFFQFASVSAGIINRFATTVLREPALKYLHAYDPDIIISTFPIISYGAARLMREERWPKRVPLISIVTDAGDVHRLWLMGGDDAILVATPDTMAFAVEKGVPMERMHYLGFPVDPSFARLPDKAEARRRLGLEQDKLTVLYMPLAPGALPPIGGGLGTARKTVRLGEFLAGQELGLQHLFLSGKNPRLKRALERLPFRDAAHVYGYVDDMPLMFAAADVVVGKAGWLSLYESMVAQRPVIIMNMILGQEEPNAEFVQSHGMGKVITDPEAVAAELARYARDPKLVESYQAAFHQYRLDPMAGQKIARFIDRQYGEVAGTPSPAAPA